MYCVVGASGVGNVQSVALRTGWCVCCTGRVLYWSAWVDFWSWCQGNDRLYCHRYSRRDRNSGLSIRLLVEEGEQACQCCWGESCHRCCERPSATSNPFRNECGEDHCLEGMPLINRNWHDLLHHDKRAETRQAR